VARWYDPAIAHFAQADTIGLDRYSYVGYNPIRLIDPSGHMACEGTGDCRAPKKTKFTKQDYINMVKEEFGWKVVTEAKIFNATVDKDTWKYQEVKTIYEAAHDILEYANATVSGGAGLRWMEKYLGDVSFIHQPFEKLPSMNPAANFVFMEREWITSAYAKLNLVHELGHVVDNRSTWHNLAVWKGGGLADRFAWRMGANMFELRSTYKDLRWARGSIKGLENEDLWGEGKYSITTQLGYGNNSSADYFAHAFAYSVLSPLEGPDEAIQYMNFIMSTL